MIFSTRTIIQPGAPIMPTIYPRKYNLVLALAIGGLLAVAGTGLALSDEDDDENHHKRHEQEDHRQDARGWISSRADIAPVTDATYAEECGACHMAYQPGLLPAAAWRQVMTPEGLVVHYGDDASMPQALRSQLAAYLDANAGDSARRSRSRAFTVGNTGDGDLPRITATRYFRNKHHEIPRRMVANNSEVGSFSNCNACHRSAEEGIYNEHQVRIPGFGRWDD
ncbi:MAG: hypothetical protein N838_27515 [Thiohalocapsa sp. PB-PSB1]|jgi:hypothetical protein|nr:MAG: hypothetical protein N838_27515 [Thiohalocapsa sp. PB-PSB1]